MSTFAKKNFGASIYDRFRPGYNQQFYKLLKDYVFEKAGTQPPIQRALDLGCGTGSATFPLLELSKKVIGVDLSEGMIEVAKTNAQSKHPGAADSGALQFKIGTVESFVSSQEIESGSCDLITAAQCIHWFHDYPSFFKNAHKLLRPGGVLAYFYYLDPVILDYSGSTESEKPVIVARANKLYQDLAYDDPSKFGPHWEQPGRNILKGFCSEVDKNIPHDLFEDIRVVKYDPDFTNPTLPSEKDLSIHQPDAPLESYIDYIRTYSSYHTYCDKHGTENGLIDNFARSLESELDWDRKSTKIDLVFKTGYTFIRKK